MMEMEDQSITDQLDAIKAGMLLLHERLMSLIETMEMIDIRLHRAEARLNIKAHDISK